MGGTAVVSKVASITDIDSDVFANSADAADRSDRADTDDPDSPVDPHERGPTE